MSIVVMKFGGAALKSPGSFSHIADLIQGKRKEGLNIIVVVSAMGDMTDQLISLAHEVHPTPPVRELDMLISAGERMSMSLLAMALEAKGIEAVSFTGSQAGIITSKDHTEARILGVRPLRLPFHLQQGRVVVVAGFQGVSEAKEITTLGRGGSDTTAVALGAALGATSVELYKDVGGIYDRDPVRFPQAKHYPHLTFDQASEIISKSAHPILHSRALNLAKEKGVLLRVLSFLHPDKEGTLISKPAHSKNNQ